MSKFCLRILISFCAFAVLSQGVFATTKRNPVDVEIKSYDEFKIVGSLDIPNYASVECKAPLVIFLHSICQDSNIWGEFPKEIKDSLSVATLNLDLRGHGKSVKDKNGKTLHWQDLAHPEYKKMPEDIIEVLNYIETEYPEIDSKKIAIVGASLGATVGLMTASFGDKIDTVIMFSPMLEYKGFDLRLPIVKYGKNPLLFLVSKKDAYSYESCQELIKLPQGKKQLEVYPFGGHGEDLLRFQPDSGKLVAKWLRDNFFDGTIVVKHKKKMAEKKFKKVKYKKVGEYFGKIKKDRDIHGSVH